MFDIGWSELLLIAVIALIVVGPKELPGLLRVVGRYVAKIRLQASQFREQVEDAIKDTEIDDLKNEMTGIRDDIRATMHETGGAVKENIEQTKDTLSEVGREQETGEPTRNQGSE